MSTADENVKKRNVVKLDAVDWEFDLEVGSNKVTAKGAYRDDYTNWMARCPLPGSPHPDLGALTLHKISAKRQEGWLIDVTLSYESNNPEASYPGRKAKTIKRYSMELTSSQEPLLTNHLFKDLSDKEKEALQQLLGSGRTTEEFATATAAVSSTAGTKAIEKIRRGIDAYLNPGLIWTERFTSKCTSVLDLSKILKTTNSPPGNCPSGGTERNWLYLGGTAEQSNDGEFFDITKKWQLSERGKWDENLYPDGA